MFRRLARRLSNELRRSGRGPTGLSAMIPRIIWSEFSLREHHSLERATVGPPRRHPFEGCSGVECVAWFPAEDGPDEHPAGHCG